MSRTWLVTGCSSGFGRLLAERVHSAGDRVVATARTLQTLHSLGAGDESRILRLALDVTDPDEVPRVVKQATASFGPVDILVNNAGYGYFATQEEGEPEEVRRVFETNVFGVIAMTQAIVPSMRERRSGVVVNISSVGGRVVTPRGGFYQATKWALEALSEALYLEESGFGVRVVVIEPGSYETDFASRSVRRAQADLSPESPFASLRELWRRNAAGIWNVPRQNPAEVVEAIIDAVDSDAGFLRIPVGRDATELIQRRQDLGPSEFLEWIRQAYNRS